jgi:hypothetical protein
MTWKLLQPAAWAQYMVSVKFAQASLGYCGMYWDYRRFPELSRLRLGHESAEWGNSRPLEPLGYRNITLESRQPALH